MGEIWKKIKDGFDAILVDRDITLLVCGNKNTEGI